MALGTPIPPARFAFRRSCGGRQRFASIIRHRSATAFYIHGRHSPDLCQDNPIFSSPAVANGIVYETMREVSPGDIIFSFVDTVIAVFR
jgi:hypothetical protein